MLKINFPKRHGNPILRNVCYWHVQTYRSPSVCCGHDKLEQPLGDRQHCVFPVVHRDIERERGRVFYSVLKEPMYLVVAEGTIRFPTKNFWIKVIKSNSRWKRFWGNNNLTPKAWSSQSHGTPFPTYTCEYRKSTTASLCLTDQVLMSNS